jgi:hypothetical protein
MKETNLQELENAYKSMLEELELAEIKMKLLESKIFELKTRIHVHKIKIAYIKGNQK